MTYEPWRKTLIIQLFENTKDAVEVAKRHYLESRLANGLKREMRELRGKFESFCKQDESQVFETLSEFKSLELEADEAILQLKARSEEFVRVSSHGLPSRVEKMSFADAKSTTLPNYSKFLFDSKMKSFGPISEKWENLKASLTQEFMTLVQSSSRISMSSMGRSRFYSSVSITSAITNNSDDDHIADVDTLKETLENNSEIPEGAEDVGTEEGEVSGGCATPDRDSDVLDTAHDDNNDEVESPKADPCSSQKPAVKQRRKHSFKRTFSGAWKEIMTSAAQSAEAKRIPSVSSRRNQEDDAQCCTGKSEQTNL